jgi:two-component system, NarL family, response regulator DevR
MRHRKPTGVVIVDDHTLFREGVRLIIEHEPDLTVLGEASSVADATALIEQVQPDLVLLDLRLAHARGVDLLARLASSPSPARVLVVTAFPDESDIAEALRLGAKGVVLKDASRQTMLAAMRTVRDGQIWLPPDVSLKVIATLTRTAPSAGTERLGQLTSRERDIVALVGEGLKNRQIADHLGITEKTIKGHLTTIFLKVGVEDRLELALLAIKAHLSPPARPAS